MVNNSIMVKYIMKKSHNMPLIIAVSGKLGTGKDYIIEHYVIPLLHQYNITNVCRMAFADHIKINVSSTSDIPIETIITGRKSEDVRRLLQLEGTERGRNIHGQDIWVKTLENWIKLRYMRDKSIQAVLVTDCRFPNEAKWIEQHDGLLIKLTSPYRNECALQNESHGNRDIYDKISTHVSEVALNDYKFINVVDNQPGKNPQVAIKTIINDYFNYKT